MCENVRGSGLEWRGVERGCVCMQTPNQIKWVCGYFLMFHLHGYFLMFHLLGYFLMFHLHGYFLEFYLHGYFLMFYLPRLFSGVLSPWLFSGILSLKVIFWCSISMVIF